MAAWRTGHRKSQFIHKVRQMQTQSHAVICSSLPLLCPLLATTPLQLAFSKSLVKTSSYPSVWSTISYRNRHIERCNYSPRYTRSRTHNSCLTAPRLLRSRSLTLSTVLNFLPQHSHSPHFSNSCCLWGSSKQ